jgi:hypothetical protein
MTDPDKMRASSRTVVAISIANVASLLLFVYYVGGWTADVKSEQRHMTDALNALQAAVYTRPEAQSDRRVVEVQLGDLARRVSTLEDRRVAKVRVQE